MHEMLQALIENYEAVIVMTLAFYACVSAIVALTPTTKDDDVLRKFLEYASILTPSDVRARTGQIFSLPGTRVQDGDDA
jgi:hypothetical protein